MVNPTQEEGEKALAKMDEQINKGIDYIKWGLNKINKTLTDLEYAFQKLNNGDMEDNELDEVLQYAEKNQQELLTHEMAFYTAMHVIQSWLMGRENVFGIMPKYYEGRELKVAKGIRIFEFFYGLKILYEHIDNGIADNYKTTEGLQVLSESPYKK
jgi:hypothetical protein